MARRIIWTQNANNDLHQLSKYLKEEWSKEIAQNFNKKLFMRIELISKFPHLGKPSIKSPSIRKIVITKHNSLYYLVDKENIVLLNIFDTRQNPNKITIK